MGIKALADKIRNLFNIATLKKRDGKTITVKTDLCRTLEAEELFPYGFYSKALEGKVIVLSQGGNTGSYILLPVCSSDGVPDLKDGDSCLWTKDGAFAIARKSGNLELNGTDFGGIVKADELKKQLDINNKILNAILEVIKVPLNEPGNGSPSVFQGALKTAIELSFAIPSGNPNEPPIPQPPKVGDFSNIKNDKVQHGQG